MRGTAGLLVPFLMLLNIATCDADPTRSGLTYDLHLSDIPGSATTITFPSAPDSLLPYALIAGGSKGIGYALAEAMAKRRYNLMVIARHADSLLAAKNRLETTYKVYVEIIVYDQSREDAAVTIAKWCTDNNIRLKMLCNVAGLGGTRDYLSLSLDTLQYMVRLNVSSCMALSLTLLPLLEKNAPSFILNVASSAAFR